MKKLYTLFGAFLFGVLCLTFFPRWALASADTINTSARQAIVIDYDTGTVLYSKNADERMPTSSMSKVMTMYVVFGALQRQELNLDSTLLVSEKAWKKGGSKMFVPVGEKVKVEDLIRGVIVQSGNDATIVLAEGIAGTEKAFAQIMNQEAKAIGMENSNFVNASGWPDPDHFSTARDLATMARAIIRNFPDYYHYYSQKDFTYNDIHQRNRNPLLRLNIGVDGLKTGHTAAGGYGLIASGKAKDGRRVIMVINGIDSTAQRKEEGARLMRWAMNAFKSETLFEDNPVLGQANVYFGQEGAVDLVAQKPVKYVVKKAKARDVKVDILYKEPLKAPLKKGQDVGRITVHVPGTEKIEIPLVTAHSVQEAGIFVRAISKARLLSTGAGKLK
ncbi:MAG: D-alanyl-D-alanine carboxypeptidase family protein [Alphaproteobacteria bacterium]